MDRKDAEQQVRTLAVQLVEQRALAENARRNAAGLSTIIRGYVQMFPELESIVEEINTDAGMLFTSDEDVPRGAEDVPRGAEDVPRGAEDVRAILQGSMNRWF